MCAIRNGSPLRFPRLFKFSPEMRCYTLANNFAQRYRHRVSDHSAQCLEMHRSAVGNEGIGLGKTLKNRTFSQGNGTILFRVPEAAISETIELWEKAHPKPFGHRRPDRFCPSHDGGNLRRDEPANRAKYRQGGTHEFSQG